jgi:tetratricopeptide (TPR) repeat protein
VANTASAKAHEVAAGKTSVAATKISGKSYSIRAASNAYFSAAFLAFFAAALLVYLRFDLAAGFVFAVAILVVPTLLFTDKIIFDGEFLERTGIVPNLWARLNGLPKKLSIGDIEQVETHSIRALKRGGNVFYRYRTVVQGKDSEFVFASGGEDYRQIIKALFAKLSDDALDNRSLELRDYLTEPKETLMKAEFARLPSSDVLENSLNEFQTLDRSLRTRRRDAAEIGAEELEKADYLRRLANELKLSGYLLQSLEAFRRALVLKPNDAWLIFEYARCLYSFAKSERNEKLEQKARAALRLAELRGASDAELLSRLGESYFQYGDWSRARKVFLKALDAAQENFRSMRGLAEIALREGKIAHVIHHFATAVHFADTKALQNWARGETEYFSRLNTDEKYMEREISRIGWLESILRGKKMALRFALIGFAAIIFGMFTNDFVTEIGWTVSTISLLIWVGLIMSANLLTQRSPLIEAEE